MKRNKKLTISALAVLLVMALTVTVVSFSLAGNDNKGELVDEAVFVAATVDANTNIDNIIENSYKTGEGTDPVYKIVEIGSGSPSNLKTLVASGGFENYVINGNTTLDNITITDPTGKESITAAIMNAECITYEFYKASDVDDDNETALAAISNADFIYVSNDESSKYSKSNDIGEELYNILHTYAVGDYKPLIIDNIGNSGGSDDNGGGSTGSKYSMANLAAKVFDKSGKYYYTFEWDKTAQTAEQFLTHQKGSAYLGINGDKKSSKWTEVTLKSNASPSDTTVTYKMSEVLVISNGAQTFAPQIFDGFNAPLADVVDMSGNPVTGDIYDIKTDDTLFYKSAYNARYARPDLVKVKEILIADVAAEDFDKYDLIIIEEDCNTLEITEAVYKKFGAAMYASTSIIYSADMSSSTSSSTGTGAGTSAGNTSVQQETNYSELFYMVATSTGQVRYENVMITNKTEFDFIALSNSSATCKVIADLINASAYRGNGGPKNSSNKFTVLEIQPCYPIDEELAAKQNNYYTIPADVMNNVTKEEIPEGTEYYAWELSKAKIANAFNISADQVVIDHMSTEQLASTKDDLFGNYDLVYIGGNTSALRDIKNTRAFFMQNGATTLKDITNVTKLPVYTMYTHNGPGIAVDLTALAYQGEGAMSGTPTAKVVVNGKAQNSFSLLNGNDITYNKLQQLQEYAEKGMPVVFSSRATLGYYAARDDKYNQNSIDPDSNMFKFMDFCGSNGFKNVLWGFDETAVMDSDNNGGDYGDTLTGYVSIFQEDAASQLQTIYNKSGKRPKLTLTAYPANYNMYDEASVVKNKNLKFEYKIAGSTNYKVELFIDDNSNSVFASDEYAATGGKEVLEYKVPDSYSGPLYWKLVVTDEASKQETSTTGLTFIAASSTAKQKIRVLQIMPGTYNGPGDNTDYNKRPWVDGEGAQAENSLYFCTVCMEAYCRLEYNPAPDTNRTDYQTYYDGHYKDNINGMARHGSNIYLGLHEHEFGIVKYDSTGQIGDYIGADNWDWNLADEVSDKYDFDLEIMMRSEYVDLCDAIASQSYNSNYIYALDAKEATKETAAQLKADIVANASNPYAAGTDENKKYAEADVAGKYDMLVSEAKNKNQISSAKAKLRYDAYSSLVMYDEDDFREAFADYPYIDELYMEIPKLSVDQLAVSGVTKSALDAEIELRLALMDMVEDLGGKDTPDGAEIYRLLTTRHYWDLYCTGSHKYAYNPYTTNSKKAINVYYNSYVLLNDLKIEFYNDYKTYGRYAAGSMDWMLNNTKFEAKVGEVTTTEDGKKVVKDVMYVVEPGVDMVVIGASENFAGDDFTKIVDGKEVPAQRALDDLEYYLASDGNALMFHDTVTRFTDAGTAYLTDMIRPYAGMDRNHMEIDEKLMSDDAYYVPYVSENEKKYFMTDLSIAGSTYTGKDKYTKWRTEFNNTLSTWWGMPEYYLTDVAYSDPGAVPDSNGAIHDGALPYKYANQKWNICAFWLNDTNVFKDNKIDGNHGTDKASKTNEGIVTIYPFTLSDHLNITPTHAQAYALDIEDDDCTVWYSLNGTAGKKEGGSIFAASPNDGMDSYFIYTYGNFNYCGAGHCNVTGVLKDNNDERRLYINIICNSVKKSVAQPDIFVYDYKTQKNDKIKKSGEIYVTKVDTAEEYPEFSFLANLDKDAQIAQVRIYYDLDYLTTEKDEYSEDANHKLIADWTSDKITLEKGKLINIFSHDVNLKVMLGEDNKMIPEEYVDENGDVISSYVTMLKLQPSYFDPYNGQYTYIVIEVIDSKGQHAYKRIKIQLKDKLFNLT